MNYFGGSISNCMVLTVLIPLSLKKRENLLNIFLAPPRLRGNFFLRLNINFFLVSPRLLGNLFFRLDDNLFLSVSAPSR